tara:strand:+ start:9992 stop:10843 length:852 start_codon:yes stop_codon:yes gene_type:complete
MNDVDTAPAETGQVDNGAILNNAEAQQETSWLDSVPEEIRGDKSLSTIPDVGTLAKNYVNAQRMIGADKVALLGKYATQEEYDQFYSKIGRPDAPTDYQYEIDEQTDVSDETVTWASNVFHKAGLTPRQANIVMQEYLAAGQGASAAFSPPSEQQVIETRNQTIHNLQKEWGADYEDNLAVANAVVLEFGSEELREATMPDGTTLGDNPDFIRLLNNVGSFIRSRVSEDTLEGSKLVGGLSASDAREKLREIKAVDSPFWSAKHPEHQWYVDEAMRYQEIIDG